MMDGGWEGVYSVLSSRWDSTVAVMNRHNQSWLLAQILAHTHTHIHTHACDVEVGEELAVKKQGSTGIGRG